MKPRDFENFLNRVIVGIETPQDLNQVEREDLISDLCALRDGYTEIPGDAQDMELHSGTCGIIVHNLSVYVKRSNEGVEVSVFPLDKEDGLPLTTCSVEFLKTEEV